MMTKTWQKITSLPADGTIIGISGAKDSSETGAGDLWLCSPAGLFCEKNGLFTHQLRGIPFRSTSAVLVLEKNILAAGYPNHIIHSSNGGHTWFSSRVEQIDSAVTCFAASPNFSRDATVLAGSDGDGILRSTDGGNSWQLSNFGLGSFTILDIACAQIWTREVTPNAVACNYEIIYAATEKGVYQSPNAGRAWRFAGEGLPLVPVLSIAISPDFKRVLVPSNAHYNGAVFAGTDGAGLYRSNDGGQSWQVIKSIPTEMTINSLYFDSKGTLYVGTGGHGILASPDLGETWNFLLETEDVILCLAAHGSKLLAGTAEKGLLALDDELPVNILE